MIRLRAAASVISGLLTLPAIRRACLTKQLAVANQIHGMFVVAPHVDVQTDLMQKRRQVQQQFHARFQLMLCL